jgi:hypothetical protein
VWAAIATAPGLSAWFAPCDVDEHEGGQYVVHMGESSSHGRVAGWEPPYRFVTEEPDWAAFFGHEGAETTPLVTEYLIEAQSGGTCTLRVVSSAFGTGADFEREFFADAERFWVPTFDHHLRLYLSRFPGQQATVIEAGSDVDGASPDVAATMLARLGASEAGDQIDLHGLKAEVDRISDTGAYARFTEPECGYLNLVAYQIGEGKTRAGVTGYFFGDDAPSISARQHEAWSAWLDRLAARDNDDAA